MWSKLIDGRKTRAWTRLTLLSLLLCAGAAAKPAPEPGRLTWHPFPDSARFRVLGLQWFSQNKPELWRMPAGRMSHLPNGVQNRAKCPSGARIAFRSDTPTLAIKAHTAAGAPARAFDLFVDGRLCTPNSGVEPLRFNGLGSRMKDFVIYLPHLQGVTLEAIGTEPGAVISLSGPRFSRGLPVVFYGSSVCQGSGSQHPSTTYPAAACRKLSLDFINLGFGGSGKAEPEVVDLVKSIDACCFVLDLGKSYGMQEPSVFRDMLVSIRKAHPSTPIIVITPITSAREVTDAAYSARSIHTRQAMRSPTEELIQAGDSHLYLIEGEQLLGFKDHHLLSKDGVHPSAEGYSAIAARLLPDLARALALPLPAR